MSSLSAMMLGLLLAQVAPTRVAVTGVTMSGIARTTGDVYLDRFVARLQADDLHVTTQRELAQLLGLERQKQLFGCNQDSCLAEIAAGLGVDALISGSMARTGEGFVATFRVLKASNGQALKTLSERVADESALFDWLDDAAAQIRAELRPRPPSSNVVKWVPGIVGGVLAAGGIVCLSLAASDYATLVGGGALTEATISATRQRGATLEPIGYTLLGIGVAGVVTSILWAALAPSSARVSLDVRPGVVGLALSGAF